MIFALPIARLLSRDNSTLEQIDKKQLVEMINQMKGGNGDKIVDAYAKASQTKSLSSCFGLILSSREKCHCYSQPEAGHKRPWSIWHGSVGILPLFDGRMRAFHCLDICFIEEHRLNGLPIQAVESVRDLSYENDRCFVELHVHR